MPKPPKELLNKVLDDPNVYPYYVSVAKTNIYDEFGAPGEPSSHSWSVPGAKTANRRNIIRDVKCLKHESQMYERLSPGIPRLWLSVTAAVDFLARSVLPEDYDPGTLWAARELWLKKLHSERYPIGLAAYYAASHAVVDALSSARLRIRGLLIADLERSDALLEAKYSELDHSWFHFHAAYSDHTANIFSDEFDERLGKEELPVAELFQAWSLPDAVAVKVAMGGDEEFKRHSAATFLEVNLEDATKIWPIAFNPEALEKFEIQSRTLIRKTGGQGAPTSMPPILVEAKRLLAAGKKFQSHADFCKHLHDWFGAHHPGVPNPTPRTIENSTRKLWKEHKPTK